MKHKKAKAECAKNVLTRRHLQHRKGLRLTDFTATQSVLFWELEKRPVALSFDQTHGSSDGGAILLSAANQRYNQQAGLIEKMSACLPDTRQCGKVDHQLAELMRQRVYGLACGYEDANDAARIGHDPMHKLLAGRDPIKGLDLASQPTLSRFENSVTPRSLYAMGMTLAESVITRHSQRRNGHAHLSPSTWTRPTPQRMVHSSCPSLTRTTTTTAICPCWASSASKMSRISICAQPYCGPVMWVRQRAPWACCGV
jgi:hypothetical protein